MIRQTAQTTIEATIKIRIDQRLIVGEDYDTDIIDALYQGDVEIIDVPKIDKLEITDVQEEYTD